MGTRIARYREIPVGARKKVGKGEVYYLGTNLGASISAGNDSGIEWLRAIVSPLVKPRVTSASLRPRLIEGKTRSLLAVFNDSVEKQTARIEIPIAFRRALDIHSQQRIAVEKNSIQIEVPHQDVRVFLME
ncbi:MAG: hypothetical protein L0387_46335 [Acidobacteria bacterium]|nr:hypothetical protein [Acidobacteriota bacterium]